MKLFSSLQNRIFLSSALVAVLSVAFAIQFVTRRVTRQTEAELRRGLEEAATLVEERHAARVQTLMLVARLIADLPKLKAAVATGDGPTVAPLARDYQARARAELFVIADRQGRVLAALHAGGPVPAMGPPPARAGSLALVDGREGVLEVASVPIVMDIGSGPEEVLGTLSLGFAFDDALAAELKAATPDQLAFVVDGRIRASTLPDSQRRELEALPDRARRDSLVLGGDEYLAVERTLSISASAPVAPSVVILRSRSERLRVLRAFRTGLVAAALVAVGLGVLLSYVVARTVTRPLAALTEAMQEMTRTGDLDRPVHRPRPWQDEDARVLAAAFDTLTRSLARFQREAALRERLSALGRLSTVIAHEVRNPLMIIKTALHTLRRAGAPSDEAAEAVADIEQEAARLNRIVDDVLDFARPLRLEYAPTDLDALCREAVAGLSAEAAARTGLRLAVGPEPVVTDGERLRAALVNMLSNAWDAVAARPEQPPGDGGPDVELRTEPAAEGRVAIEVVDRGVGIAAADLPNVFEPYFTTKRAGSGLGLAIAKNVIDALGGTVSVHSEPGRGTAVRIEIPRSPAAVALPR